MRESLSENIKRVKNNISSQWNANQSNSTKKIDLSIKGNAFDILSSSVTLGVEDNNNYIDYATKQAFLYSADEDGVPNHNKELNINRKIAKRSSGEVIFTGTNGSIIPVGTSLTDASGNEYTTKSEATISDQSTSLLTLTYSGVVASAKTNGINKFYNGQTITISGSDDVLFNGSFVITLVDNENFTYILPSIPSANPTGTFIASASTAFTNVDSDGFGADKNKGSGVALELVNPIINVDNSVYCGSDGLAGAIDLEDLEVWRKRGLEKKASYGGNFSVETIKIFIKNELSGFTRIWVKEATPEVGDVEIYLIRDGDINIIPSYLYLEQVKAKLCDGADAIKPANIDRSLVYVLSPTAVSTDFNFDYILPNNSLLKEAVKTNLTNFFKSEQVNLETNILESEYKAIIDNSIDSNGNKVASYSLTSPSGDIVVGTGKLGTLGSVNYV